MVTEGLGEVVCECDEVVEAAVHGMAALVGVGAANAGDEVGDIARRRSGDERSGDRLGFSGSKTRVDLGNVEAMTRADLGNVDEGEEAEHKETATDNARRVCRAEERASPRAGWGATAVRPLSRQGGGRGQGGG